MQATLMSHHSGMRGRITATRSPLCRPQGLVSTLAAFRDKEPRSRKLHFTSSPLPFTHHRAGLAGLSPDWPGTHGKEKVMCYGLEVSAKRTCVKGMVPKKTGPSPVALEPSGRKRIIKSQALDLPAQLRWSEQPSSPCIFLGRPRLPQG